MYLLYKPTSERFKVWKQSHLFAALPGDILLPNLSDFQRCSSHRCSYTRDLNGILFFFLIFSKLIFLSVKNKEYNCFFSGNEMQEG